MRTSRSVSVFARLVLFVVLTFSSTLFARPGGGGSYHGGGHSSSGGGGGHSGMSGGGSTYHGGGSTSGPSTGSGGGVLALLIVGGIILLVIVLSSRKNRENRSVRSAVLDAQFDRDAENRGAASIAVLQSRDPKLTETSISDRARLMSDRIRDAWCAGDMRPARAFVSDGVFSRFQKQLELMRQDGVKNVMSDAEVLYVTIEGVDSAPPIDAVHVRLTAQARDANVPLDSNPAQISQTLARLDVTPYTEIWTLVRKYGALTKLDTSQVGRACPSCGAPLSDGSGGEMLLCKYCKALVCSGEHDWVLAEITQLEEWRPTSEEVVPGLEKLRQVDTGAAREPIEDRASYLFWNWIETSRATQPMNDVAVGGADLLFVDVAESEPMDYAFVQIFWSARFSSNQEPTPQKSVFRLARKTGVSTKFSMTSIICQNCGALLSESANVSCSHCQAPVSANGQTWTLDAVLVPGSPEIRPRHRTDASPLAAAALLPDITDPRERNVLFVEMARLMAANGKIEKDEKRLLTTCGARWGITDDVVARALSGQLGGSTTPLQISSPDWFLSGLVAAALIDGTIDQAERETLERACTALGVSHQVLDAKVTEYKAQLERG